LIIKSIIDLTIPVKPNKMKVAKKKATKKATTKNSASSKTVAKKSPVSKTTTVKRDPIVHFEMPAEDKKRMAKFYTNAFGWKTQMLGEDTGGYVLATTASELDKAGRPKRVGIINGGFFQKSADMPAQYPSVVIAVDDINKSMKKLTKAGGKVIGDPMEIPNFGTYVSFYDTEGNRVSIMEPTMEMKEKTKK
jgi:predicted enzyme related to lactoylglutathione lyase